MRHTVGTLQERSRVQSDLERDLKVSITSMIMHSSIFIIILYMQASTMLRQGHRSRTQNSKTQYIYREPQTVHAQRPRVNAREYRARARSQRGR